jgi:phage head maturation protease
MRNSVTFTAVNFAVDAAQRTLTGILLPFGEISRPALNPQTGQPALWTFTADTVTVPDDTTDAVLNYGHDEHSLNMQLGAAASLDVTAEGVAAVFKIARTPEGDRVLALAEDGVLKAFSAEVEGDFDEDAKGGKDGLPLMRSKAVLVTGGAVVRKPAFLGAQITSVAASAASTEEKKMTETIEAPTSFSKADGDKLMADVQTITEQLAELKKVKIPVGPGTAQFAVTEEPIYRFAGSIPAPSGFDFAADLLAVVRQGDGAALERLQKFTQAEADAPRTPRFANQPTSVADVANINPSVYRPDMFLGQAPTPASPLYDFFHKGGLSNITPFFYSKLDRANTDVGVTDHVEDTDPETRDIVTAAGATVTPAAVSGQVHLPREVADQGGNPNVSGLIKIEFDRSFAIALETKTAALVTGSAATELGSAIAAGSSGRVAGAAVEDGLVGLQFLADGFRFEKAFGHIELYKALAAAEVTTVNSADAEVNTGEKIYPIINPQNATGQAASKWSYMDIGGYRMSPAASLGASGTGQKSYVADPFAVHVWNSGLQSLEKLQETVAGWNIGVFAYFAGIVYDVTGLRKITYDSTP